MFKAILSRFHGSPSTRPVGPSAATDFDHFAELDDKFKAANSATDKMRKVVHDAAGLSTAIINGLSNLKLVAKFMDSDELQYCALLSTDEAGTIRSSQYNVERIFGMTAGSLKDRNIKEFIAPRFLKYYEAQLSKLVLSDSNDPYNQVIEIVYLKVDGTEVHCEERTKVISTEGGLIYQKLLKDITNLRVGEVPYETFNRSTPNKTEESLSLVLKLDPSMVVTEVVSSELFDSDLLLNYRLDRSPFFSMNRKFWTKLFKLISMSSESKSIANLVVKARYKSDITYFTCKATTHSVEGKVKGVTFELNSVNQDLASWTTMRHDVLFAISEISNDLISSSLASTLPRVISKIKGATRATFVSLSKYSTNYHLNLPTVVRSEDPDLIEFEPKEEEQLKRGRLVIRTSLEFSSTSSVALLNNKISLVVFIPIIINSEIWGTLNIFYTQNYPSVFTLKYLESLSSILGSAILREHKGSDLKILNMAFESLFVASPLPMIFHINGIILSLNGKARELLGDHNYNGQEITSILPNYNPTTYVETVDSDKLFLVATSDLTYENEVYSQVVLTDLTEIHHKDKYIKALTAATSRVEDIILITNREYKVVYANPASVQSLNVDLIDKPLHDIPLFSQGYDKFIEDLNSSPALFKTLELDDLKVDLSVIKILNLKEDPIFYILIGKIQ